MSKDYHRGPTESIPVQDEYRPVVSHNRPQGHYSSDTGAWDGQLPHPDVVVQAKNTEEDSPNWPNYLERSIWSRAIIRAHQLPPPQAAVMNEIVFRDGRGVGCTATMATIALDTGYNEKSVRTAIKALVDKRIIIANGGPGQRKILGLPVKDGQLPWPTLARTSGVDEEFNVQTPVRDSGVVQTYLSTPVTDSGVGRVGGDTTPVRDSGVGRETAATGSGVEPNPGNRFRATPVIDSDITTIEQEERENKYISSLSPSFFPGSSVRDSGVENQEDSTPRHLMPGTSTTADSLSEPTNQPGTPEEELVRALVVMNWPLLEKAGWNFLEPAIRHYRTHGISYLQRDLKIKQGNLEREERATRTCTHCNAVHDDPVQLRECVMCHQPKCVSEQQPCHRTGCDGRPRAGNQTSPRSRQRR